MFHAMQHSVKIRIRHLEICCLFHELFYRDVAQLAFSVASGMLRCLQLVVVEMNDPLHQLTKQVDALKEIYVLP